LFALCQTVEVRLLGISISRVISVHITRKNPTNANGLVVAKDLHGLMTVNAMSNYTSIIGHTSARAVERASREWMLLIDISNPKAGKIAKEHKKMP